MRIETELAKGSLDRVSRRDPEKIYHKMTKAELAALGSDVPVGRILHAMPARRSSRAINVSWPDFFKAVERADSEDAAWTTGRPTCTWHVLHSEARAAADRLRRGELQFLRQDADRRHGNAAALEALRATSPTTSWARRWARSIVERTFGAEGKERTLKMVHALEKALGEDIEKLSWMTPATKKEALVKLKAITNKIGYPEKWRDYSSVDNQARRRAGQRRTAPTQFEFQRQLEQDRQAGGPRWNGT